MSYTQQSQQRPLRAAQVAERWGVSPDLVYRAVREGRLRAHRLGPRSLRFDPEEVNRFFVAAATPLRDVSLKSVRPAATGRSAMQTGLSGHAHEE